MTDPPAPRQGFVLEARTERHAFRLSIAATSLALVAVVLSIVALVTS